MSKIVKGKKGEQLLLMGNEAIARGALEAGVCVIAGYPGTPSSEIIENLAKVAVEQNLYVEWSINEKIGMEVAAAASFAGLRSMCTMKMNGVHVASDFLLHLALTGTRGGMVLLTADDPNAHSSQHEAEVRDFARMLEIPLLEPGDFQDAKDVVKYAFELSETLKSIVIVRSTTRLSHASGQVTLGEIPQRDKIAHFTSDGFIMDPMEGSLMSLPIEFKHPELQAKIKKAAELFEENTFNNYTGPENPELLIISCSTCSLYSFEAILRMGLEKRVGLLKMVTTWPLPPNLVKSYLKKAKQVLVVEEVLPFMEENLKVLAYETADEIGIRPIFGKRDGCIPSWGELNPDLVAAAVSKITGVEYAQRPAEYDQKVKEKVFFGAPPRDLTFCPGCPHRSSFWSIENVLQTDQQKGFVCGDVGCYTMALAPNNFGSLKTSHSMGSGTGLASGFGKLSQFGLEQPVLSVCGDSTFFHAALPALINAVHNRSKMTMVILDNSGTAMTGFQPHSGTGHNVMGDIAESMNIQKICEVIGAKVSIGDPFDVEKTQETLHALLDTEGTKVLILKQPCALSPEKKRTKQFNMSVTEDLCLGENCGCNRLCTRVFRCPGLVWDKAAGKAHIDEIICTGCGVCASICPQGAITKTELTIVSKKEVA